MKGFVATPDEVVDLMVAKLFEARPPDASKTLLDPGCGEGAFVEGVLRWCRENDCDPPGMLGVEPHPGRCRRAQEALAPFDFVRVEQKDFLAEPLPSFDYVVGNPPYVPITELSEEEKAQYRKTFATARGRFDLYLLFFERALQCLEPGGRLVYVTPAKYLTVQTARPLRQMFSRHHVREVDLLAEDTFPGFVTYPAVTTLEKIAPGASAEASTEASTRLSLRDGASKTVRFLDGGASLAPQMHGQSPPAAAAAATRATLEQFCVRVSAGVATGADALFVVQTSSLDAALRPFAHATVAGRQLPASQEAPRVVDSFLVPYDAQGELLAPGALGALGAYLADPARKKKLLSRSCVPRKPWYAFHETPPMKAALRPKILCKDIAAEPHFWTDEEGALLPRHSVYYIVPRDARDLDPLAAYLNSDAVAQWLRAHCQRAANDYLRLQSTPLKRIPIPEALAEKLKGHPARGDGHRVASSVRAPTLFQ